MKRTMSDEEIFQRYRESPDPDGEIRRLAEANGCTANTIRYILKQGGVSVIKPGRGRPPKSLTQPAPAEPAAEAPEKLPGAKSDEGKLDLTQVPPEIIRAVAAIRAYGNRKYSDPENWRRVDPQKFHAALIRHAVAMWEDPWAIDPESGYPHLWHLCCNAAFLCEFYKEDKTDDRTEADR